MIPFFPSVYVVDVKNLAFLLMTEPTLRDAAFFLFKQNFLLHVYGGQNLIVKIWAPLRIRLLPEHDAAVAADFSTLRVFSRIYSTASPNTAKQALNVHC